MDNQRTYLREIGDQIIGRTDDLYFGNGTL